MQVFVGMRRSAAFIALLAVTFPALADDPSLSIGCAQQGAACGAADVSQIPPGNYANIRQIGNANTAMAEQQAILGRPGNAALISQDGSGNKAKVVQQGSGNLAAIAQYGDGETATAKQFGTGLGVEIQQSNPGSDIIVKQFGTALPGSPTIKIRQF